VGTDDYEIDIKLRNHIPEILPMNGKRVNVSYPGQPKLCRNCLCQGHIAKECSDKDKADFLDYVARILKSGLFKEDLFGSWIDTLKKFHPDYNRPNPQDLRQVMSYNQRGLPRQDLRRNIGYSSHSDLRTRIGNQQDQPPPYQYQQDNYQQPYREQRDQYREQRDQYQHYQQEPRQYSQNRGRGRGRGRGRFNARRNFNNQQY